LIVLSSETRFSVVAVIVQAVADDDDDDDDASLYPGSDIVA